MDKTVDKAPDAFRTISEVAHDLDLPQHVLRFWETRFIQIRPMKRGGGRRFYRREDIELLRGIRHLLYGEGYTIRGVQRILKDHGVKFVQSVWQVGAPQPAKLATDADEVGTSAPSPHETHEAPRGRRLFGILPSRRSDAEDATAPATPRSGEDREPLLDVPEGPPQVRQREGLRPRPPGAESLRPPFAPAPLPKDGPRVPVKASDAGLGRDHLRKLQAALHELSECRRLIDAALDEKA